jgi:TonB-linked SusC/RagA family outer membrane protein
MKSIKKLLLLIFIILMAVNWVSAQQTIITGKVTNELNVPMPNVNVSVKGTVSTTQTNATGIYSLNLKSGSRATLIFSFVGYKTKEVEIKGGKRIYNVSLEINNTGLDEVVVIGYGTTKRKDLTGSVGSVNVSDLQKAPTASFDQALAGRVAGVQVSASDGQPGGEMNIVVRGNNSVTQDNSPLYVIDGFPIETSLNNVLNPSEIESIEVLKDASATAIYGARGANGVIIITTKRGKEGKPTINYQAFAGIQKEIKRIDVMNPYEFVKYQLELDSSKYAPIFLENGRKLDDYKHAKAINWQDRMFRPALIQNHSLSVNGGNKQTKYSLSGSYLGQDGIIINGGYNRYQGRVVLDQRVNSKMKVGVNVNYTSSKKYGTQVGAAQGSPTSTLMYSIWGYRPVTGSDSGDVKLADEPYDPEINPATDYRFNPVLTAENTFRPVLTNTLFTNAYIDYSILDNLKVRITGGLTRRNVNSQVFNNSNTQSGNPISSINGINGSISNSELTNLVNENTLTYSPTISSDQHLSIMGGFTTQKVRTQSAGFTSIDVPNESLGISGLDEGIVSDSKSSQSINTLASLLGRINYDLHSKYLVTVSFRADGSSKFDAGNKWSYFPSASLGWRIINEPFMKKLTFISDAKIRGGYGLTGNNRVSDFAYLSSYEIASESGYSYNNSPVQGIIPNDLGTRDLKWETTGQTDIGIDLGFWKNRILLTADYYKKVTSDLLLNASIAPSMGYLKGLKNVGKVSNQGLEFTLSTVNIQKRDFSWSSNFNISFNKNKVIQLNEGQPNLQTSITWGNFSAAPYIAIPGQPIALFYGYQFNGVYQYSDFDKQSDGSYLLKDDVPNNGLPRTQIQPGYIKYKDINGDGEVNSADMTIIGNPNPKYTGGFSNNFHYKSFDLNVFLQWSYGNDIMNTNRIEFEGGEGDSRTLLNQYASFVHRWSPTNPTNQIYGIGGAGPNVYSSRIIEDGSYLRLKTVSLGYNLPQSILQRINVKSLRVYISAQNLITWTNYSGVDPEVSVRNSALTPGFDLSAYPQSKTVSFGINLNL